MEKTNDKCHEHGHKDHTHQREVHITVDGQPKEVTGGEYLVSKFKALIGVPPDYELEHVIKGVFHPLADTAKICVENHEVFVGHVRQGGSS